MFAIDSAVSVGPATLLIQRTRRSRSGVINHLGLDFLTATTLNENLDSDTRYDP